MSNCNCTFKDYFASPLYTWCSNCGNYGIHAAVKRALVAECIEPQNALLCFDIGCNGNGSDKIGGYRFHGLHGRILPFACGAAVANRQVKVLAFGGDGGTLGEGINHLVHAIRANFDITFILHNNLNYGLTLGQASPTTKPDMKMNSSPDGPTADTLHVMNFIFGLNPSFVGRTFSGDIKHMTNTIQAGLRHKGFSFIEIFQSCPTYNKATPHEWYMNRIYDVTTLPNYNHLDQEQAHRVAGDIEEKIAIGALYQDPQRPDFYSRQLNRQQITTELVHEVQNTSITELLGQFQ